MAQHESKKEKKLIASQNKKAKKKALKKKLHSKKKPPAHSTKPKYNKKYIKQAIQAKPTPIPTHYSFINNNNPTKSISSFSSFSSISSSHSSSVSHFIPSETLKNIFTIVDDTQHLNSQEPTNLSDAALAAGRSSATTTPNAIPSTNQTMQIAGPIIGIFGGIALIAALVLLNTRHRRRQRQKQIKKDIEEDQRRPDNDEKNKNLNRSGSIKSYSYNVDKTSICVPIHNKADKKCNENDLQRRFSVTDTLVDSQTASRPNSVCLKAAAVHDAPQKRASHGTRCSWLSASSSLLSETVSPTSTLIGTTTTSFMKTAERQLLHHERPSVLDHFDGQFKKNIETYRAQLADISNPLDRIDEQDGQINDEI